MRLVAAVLLSLALAVPSACNGEEVAPREYAYGADGRQRLDFWPGDGRNAPLILYIHGGGWARGDKSNAIRPKAEHFAAQGYAFASMNYRLVPDATVEEQAADVASAIAWLHSQARGLGIDSDRIILMGHSAGAHLAALVATDPDYLRRVGVPMEDIAGVVLLDGSAYHVPATFKDGPGSAARARARESAFGDDEIRQLRLSPVTHTAAPNAADFLILYVDRSGAPRQAMKLADMLQGAGTGVEARLVGNSSHMQLNRDLGGEGDEATRLVDAFVQRTATTALAARQSASSRRSK